MNEQKMIICVTFPDNRKSGKTKVEIRDFIKNAFPGLSMKEIWDIKENAEKVFEFTRS